MTITPELDRAISAIAEAKMYLHLVIATAEGTPERAENFARFTERTRHAREYVDSMPGGYEKLPMNLAVSLRVCEKGVVRLAPKEPP